jgi:hypothetical protein
LERGEVRFAFMTSINCPPASEKNIVWLSQLWTLPLTELTESNEFVQLLPQDTKKYLLRRNNRDGLNFLYKALAPVALNLFRLLIRNGLVPYQG